MGTLRLGLGLAAVIAIAALPSSAMAQRITPPDNSAVNQYTETYPVPGGGATTNDKSKRSPDKALGARNARRLEALGPEGRAAAALAAATAPRQGATSRRDATGGTRGAAGSAGGSGPKAGEPSGSSALGEVIEQATGTSSSGQMGLLLPLLIAAAAVGSLAYLWWRKRPTA